MNMYTCTGMEETSLFLHFTSSSCKLQVDRIRKKHTKIYKNVTFPYQHTQKVSHKNNK